MTLSRRAAVWSGWTPFISRVWEKAFAGCIPISGTFELTPRCNFNCKMCYVHLQPEEIPQNGVELTAKEWLRIAKEAKAAGTTWLCITGGEPPAPPGVPADLGKAYGDGILPHSSDKCLPDPGKNAGLAGTLPPRQVKVTLLRLRRRRVPGCVRRGARLHPGQRGIHNLMSVGIPVTPGEHHHPAKPGRRGAHGVLRLPPRLKWLPNGQRQALPAGGKHRRPSPWR